MMTRRRPTLVLELLLTGAMLIAAPCLAAKKKAPPMPRDADEELLAELGDGFQILPTKHFLIYYNTTPNFAKRRRLLFDKLHKVYAETFEKIDTEIRKPKKRLTVILFETPEGFQNYLADEAMKWAAGVYMQEENQVVFFDGNSDPEYLKIKEVLGYYSGELLKVRRVVRQIRHPTAKLRYTRIIGGYQKEVKTLEKKLDGMIDNQNVAVTIHEATHQLSFNLGPLERDTRPPRWLAEGIATFFETPRMGRWRGADRFNAQRYIAYEDARTAEALSTLEEVLTDESLLFDPEKVDAGYGAVWSLFYFLYQEHPEACAEICGTFRVPEELPEDESEMETLHQQSLDDFERILGGSLDEIETQWHAFMDDCAEQFKNDIAGWRRSVTP